MGIVAQGPYMVLITGAVGEYKSFSPDDLTPWLCHVVQYGIVKKAVKQTAQRSTKGG